MAQRNIIWTKTADLQFYNVLNYWVNHNKSITYSLKLLERVIKKTKRIAENPKIYKLTNFKDTRIAIIDNYSILYKTTETEIIITAFWDNRQDPQ